MHKEAKKGGERIPTRLLAFSSSLPAGLLSSVPLFCRTKNRSSRTAGRKESKSAKTHPRWTRNSRPNSGTTERPIAFFPLLPLDLLDFWTREKLLRGERLAHSLRPRSPCTDEYVAEAAVERTRCRRSRLLAFSVARCDFLFTFRGAHVGKQGHPRWRKEIRRGWDPRWCPS